MHAGMLFVMSEFFLTFNAMSNFISHLSCWFDSCVCAFHFTGMQYGDYVNNQASSAPTPSSSTSDDEEEEEEDEEAGLL